ncbi:MAG TPA: DUF5682 family protein [Saprospiraceae bacterium]|nr:DUF5682 family protein [Saprospiraceae bacterium]
MAFIKIFGIRHHGAGSSRRLLEALEQFQPDVLALELPAESTQLLPQILHVKVIAPIAFLYYQLDNPDRSIYLPLAKFSPEYQAIQYTAQKNIACVPIDLPAAVSLVSSNFSNDPEAALSNYQKKITGDPIAFLAKKAGYTDSERWWETHFEQWTDHEKLFDFIQDFMAELRNQSFGLDDEETLIREQYMRQCLRKLLKQKYKRIAVVCGAWHGPVLTQEFIEKQSAEKIKDLKSYQIACCIIPWSYKNMSLNNGYSAGIISPIWHEALIENSKMASSGFLVHAVHQMRQEGMEISPAAAIEAERLANMLALLREIPVPGIDELLQSCLTVFNVGNSESLDRIKEKLLCGSVQGSVDLGKESLPFIRIFKNILKQLRLNRFWKEDGPEILELDLRKEKHLEISRFLNYTQLVHLNWAREKEIESKVLGNFHEHWQFEWHADLEISLVRIALYGNTLQEVSRKFIASELEKNTPWFQLAKYLVHALKADLQELLPLLTVRIQSIVINHSDVLQLSTLIRPLLSGLEYGSIHKIDTNFIKNVLDQLLPKLLINLPDAVKFIDNDRSLKLLEVIPVVQLFFDKFKNHEYSNLWKEQAVLMVQDELTHPRIQGKLWNVLLERQQIPWNQFVDYMKFQFSQTSDIPKSALWFEGFIHNQSVFYLMHPEILQCLDDWIQSLEEDPFNKYLPLMRRVFESIAASERRRILSQLKQNSNPNESGNPMKLKLDLKRQNLLEQILEKY